MNALPGHRGAGPRAAFAGMRLLHPTRCDQSAIHGEITGRSPPTTAFQEWQFGARGAHLPDHFQFATPHWWCVATPVCRLCTARPMRSIATDDRFLQDLLILWC